MPPETISTDANLHALYAVQRSMPASTTRASTAQQDPPSAQTCPTQPPTARQAAPAAVPSPQATLRVRHQAASTSTPVLRGPATREALGALPPVLTLLREPTALPAAPARVPTTEPTATPLAALSWVSATHGGDTSSGAEVPGVGCSAATAAAAQQHCQPDRVSPMPRHSLNRSYDVLHSDCKPLELSSESWLPMPVAS